MLFAARCRAGIAFLTIAIAVYSLIGDTFDPSTRGRASMVVGLGQVVKSSAAFALGGYLLSRMGSAADSWRPPPSGWRPLILLVLVRRDPRRSAAIEKKPPLLDTCREAVDHRATIMILV